MWRQSITWCLPPSQPWRLDQADTLFVQSQARLTRCWSRKGTSLCKRRTGEQIKLNEPGVHRLERILAVSEALKTFRSVPGIGIWNPLPLDLRQFSTLLSLKAERHTSFRNTSTPTKTSILFPHLRVCECVRACVCVCECMRACVRAFWGAGETCLLFSLSLIF